MCPYLSPPDLRVMLCYLMSGISLTPGTTGRGSLVTHGNVSTPVNKDPRGHATRLTRPLIGWEQDGGDVTCIPRDQLITAVAEDF